MTKVFERPAFFPAAGEGVQDGEIFHRNLRHWNHGNALGGRRQGGEEGEGQVADRFAEVFTIGSVPGVNRIEGFKSGNAGALDDAHEVKTSVDDRARAAGEADQGEHGAWRPYLGVVPASGFQGGKGKDDIANSPGTNQQAPHE